MVSVIANSTGQSSVPWQKAYSIQEREIHDFNSSFVWGLWNDVSWTHGSLLVCRSYTIAWKVSSTCTTDLLSSVGKYHHLVQSICVHRHLLVVYLSTSASTCTFDLQTLAGKYHLLAQSICRHRLGSKYNILLSYFTLTFYFGLCRMAQAESIKQGVSIAN